MIMRLTDICEINPKADSVSDNTHVSFVAMPDVSENGKISTTIARPYGEVKKGFTFFKEGDVLFAKITPCMENGKGALAVGLKNGLGCGSTEFHVLRPKTDVLIGKWLYYLTAWPLFRSDAERHMTGSAGQKRVPKSFLEKYEINLPALHVQQQQVVTLDRIKRIIEYRESQLTLLDNLTKARFVEMFGDQETNPLGWPKKTIGDCCTLKSGTSLSAEIENEGGPIPYVKVGDMNYPGNEKYITTSSRYVSAATAGKGLFPVGSIIFPKRGGAIGTNKKRMTAVPICADLNVMGVTSNGELRAEYLMAYFNMIDLGTLDNGSSVPQINNKDIAPLLICIPSKEMQDTFAEFVSQIDKSKDAFVHSLSLNQKMSYNISRTNQNMCTLLF